MTSGTSLRVIVAEDHALMRAGVVSVLRAAELDVVAAVGSLDEARAGLLVHSPDVLVTDIRMPPGHLDEGIALASETRSTHPSLGVVVLSQHVNPQYALAVLDSGTGRRAYLLKDRVAEESVLVDAVRTVASGGSMMDRSVVDALLGAQRQPRSMLGFLTPREREVLEEMATGASNGRIARSLGLSERSVEKHSNSVFSKLGLTEEPDVNRRVKAVLVLLAHRVPEIAR